MTKFGFREVAEILRKSIISNELKKGELIPSEVNLSNRFSVSRTTVRRALSILEGEQLLCVIPGQGRIVSSSPQPVPHKSKDRANFVAQSLLEEYEKNETPEGSVGDLADLATRFVVSQAVIKDAIAILEKDGYISRIRGRGRHWVSGETLSTKTEEIAARLRAEILAGKWSDNTHLPSELTLAKDYEVGRVTIRRALRLLTEEGLVETKPGIGTNIIHL